MHSGMVENHKRKKNGKSKKKLFIYFFKYTFFYLEDFTFRAAPGIRNIFKTRVTADSGFWIPFFGIINIVTFKTNPTFAFFIG